MKKEKREKAEHVRSTYVSKSLYGIGRKATLMPLFRSSTVLKLRPFVINTINLPLDTRLSKLGPDISWIEKPADCGPVRSQIGNCCQRKWLVFSNSIIKKKKKEEEEEEEKGSSKLLDNIFPLESKANFLT